MLTASGGGGDGGDNTAGCGDAKMSSTTAARHSSVSPTRQSYAEYGVRGLFRGD